MTIDPTKHYSYIKNGNEDVTKVKVASNPFGTGDNQTQIAAVSGKIIRIMGWFVTSAGGGLNIKNGSGGAVLYYGPGALNGSLLFPITDSGYMETSVGVGLFVDVATAGANLTTWYIEYIP